MGLFSQSGDWGYEDNYKNGQQEIATSEWISVNDELPEIKGYYLVCCYDSYFDKYGIDIAYFRGQTKWSKYNDCITHWMWLPDTPDKSKN